MRGSPKNLILRAAKLLQSYCRDTLQHDGPLGADICIHKVLPMGGGYWWGLIKRNNNLNCA